MKLRLMLFLASVAVAVAFCVPAAAGSYGTELPFASGTGARASGMGLAGLTLPGTPSTQYFNPALLATRSHRGFEFYRTTLFDSDAQYHSLSYAHPSLDWGTIGATVLRLDVGGIEERDDSNILLSSDIKNSQTRLLLGYAVNVVPSVAAGVNLKLDRQSFAGFSGSAVGLDIGFLAQRSMTGYWFLENARVAMAIENIIEPNMKLERDDVADPMKLLLGASVDSRYGDIGFATALDLVNPKYSPFHARFGQEVSYREMAAVRFGWDGSTPTFGLGGTYRSISLDYAYREEDLGSNHRVSLSVSFGPSLSSMEDQRRRERDQEMQQRVRHKVDEFERSQLTGLVERADALFAEGDFERAREAYDMVLLWVPDHGHATERLSACELELALGRAQGAMADNNYVAALYHYKRALEIEDDDRARDGITRCETLIGETEDRTNLVNQMMSRSVDLYARGAYQDAIEGFQDVVRVDPENALAAEFIAKCRSSIQSTAQDLRGRARKQEQNGDLSAAIASLERVSKLTPDDGSVTAELSRLRGLLKRRADVEANAEAAARNRTEIMPTPSLPRFDAEPLDQKYEAGLDAFEDGEFEAAARSLLEVWTVDPAYRGVAGPLTRAYLYMGMARYGEGNYDEAISIWERVLAIDPANEKAKRYLQKTREEAQRLSGGSR